MEKLTSFFNTIDRGQDHVAKRKGLYMTILTVLLCVYMVASVRPDTINAEIILALAIAIIPILLMVSATINFITLRDTKLCLKNVLISTVIYMTIYALLLMINNKFF